MIPRLKWLINVADDLAHSRCAHRWVEKLSSGMNRRFLSVESGVEQPLLLSTTIWSETLWRKLVKKPPALPIAAWLRDLDLSHKRRRRRSSPLTPKKVAALHTRSTSRIGHLSDVFPPRNGGRNTAHSRADCLFSDGSLTWGSVQTKYQTFSKAFPPNASDTVKAPCSHHRLPYWTDQV